ncbi:MAG: phosphodiester glycosidase family protein [Candidatus Eremiobacteraeota bacterium]|nr:phosphodiester glycosidase family protein [Candidatus Eremiobacteraeota bacterium]
MVPSLPATLAPPAPFPLIVAQSQTVEFVAPGVRRATYRLQTSDGPLVVNVVAVDMREPTLRVGTVLAKDRMISSGETVSSMAHRTNAIAGVNGDYFDIGNTNQPLGIVVRQGAILRTPSKRVVLDVRTDRSVHFEPITFSGNVTYDGVTIPLTGVNEWPPQGGASLLTADYGALKPATGVTLAELVAADAAHLATQIAGTYRVAAIDATAPPVVLGPMLAFGPAARAVAPPPVAGDDITLEITTNPDLASIATAIGGGPLLLADGNPAQDSSEPAPEERERRFPVSGAAMEANSELLLASVDGRQPSLSIGVTRPQFAALFLGLGATSAMAFDSGGSATLVARVLGDASASVQNAPSDGEERRVADGFFIYSDAPNGPASQVVVRPAQIVALPHAVVPVRVSLTDAAGHALGTTHLDGGDVVRVGASPGPVVVVAGHLRATVPVDVVARLARLDISSNVRVPIRDSIVELTARGFDSRGRAIELGDAVRWRADRGTFVAAGRYRAAERDARIVATVAGTSANFDLHVGSHAQRLSFDSPELRLPYDFSGAERSVSENLSLALPGEPLSFSIEVLGDASAVAVRAAFINRFGERRVLTVARYVDWSGWQPRTVLLPDDLNPPIRLISLDIVNSAGNARVSGKGAIAFRNPSVVVAGTP